MTLLVATALPFEAEDFAESVGGERAPLGRGWAIRGSWQGVPLQLVVTGPGARRVGCAADAIAETPSAVLSAGVAGALSDLCAPGDVVLAEAVCTLDASSRVTDATLRRRAEAALAEAGTSWRCGICLGVDEVLVDEAAKRDAARASRAAIVQMEDHVWAARAADWGVPFVSLRVVLDAVDHALPEAALAFPWRGASLWDLTRVIATRPQQLPALWALGRVQRRARKALSEALHPVVAALCPDATPPDSS